MPRYIDADELYETVTKKYSDIVAGCYPYNIVAYDMARLVKEAPTADVVPRSEVDQWYHEYHVIKDELKREKMYHKETEKLADKYCAELQTAKAEVAREIFEEIENAIDLKFLIIKKMLDSKGGRANGKTILLAKCEVLTETKRFLAELEKKYTERRCPDCKHFVGCEKANWVRGCEEHREDGEKDYFTPEEVRAMSRDEVRANYFKILNSMSKWH